MTNVTEKVTDWIKENPKLAVYMLGMLLAMLTAMTGLQFTSRPAAPGEQPGIIIVLPEDSPNVFGSKVVNTPAPNADGIGSNVSFGSKFSDTGRLALRSAGGVLRERRAEREPFFAMLRDLHNDHDSLTMYEEAAKVNGFDPVTVSIAVKIAVKVAIAILERRAPETATEWDDRLLKLLHLFDANPFVIPKPRL
jgi:hypothetical protein